jgi:membrane protein DedA with SNARE-associated domain
MTSRPASRSSWTGRLLVLIVVVAGAATLLLGLRSAVTLALLESAHEAGVPQASAVRPWMTLRYLALTYDVTEDALRAELDAPPGLPPETTLKELAQRAGVSLPDYLQSAQRAIAASASPPPSPSPPTDDDAAEVEGETGWLDRLGDDAVSAVLVYGYPALAITLALGALGFPLPSGLSMVVVGALAAEGEMDWLLAAGIATAASVLGDLAGYGLGRGLGAPILERNGRRLGLGPERRERVERLFLRWGALTVLLSRSLVSALSSAVNLVAGAGRYRLDLFVALGVAGRMLWVSAYLGLGYIASGGFEPAADFLMSLTGFLVSLAILTAASVALQRSRRAAGQRAA